MNKCHITNSKTWTSASVLFQVPAFNVIQWLVQLNTNIYSRMQGILPCIRVMFYLLYNHQWKTKPCHFHCKRSDFFMQVYLNLPFSENHSNKIVNFMLDIMCPIIHEGESVPQELLDTVLVNIIEPQKVTPLIISFLWFMVFITIQVKFQSQDEFQYRIVMHNSLFSLKIVINCSFSYSCKGLLHIS